MQIMLAYQPDPDGLPMTMHELVNEQTAPEFNALIKIAKDDDGSWPRFVARARAEAKLKAKTAFLWSLIVEGLTDGHDDDPQQQQDRIEQVQEALASMTQEVCTCPERHPQ
jgi:hypothetical protein